MDYSRITVGSRGSLTCGLVDGMSHGSHRRGGVSGGGESGRCHDCRMRANRRVEKDLGKPRPSEDDAISTGSDLVGLKR